LQCVAVRCSVLRCVAVCCSVLQRSLHYVAVCCGALQCAAVRCSVLQCVAVCCSLWQFVAVCCGALQCVAVCCSVLQCVALCCSALQCVAVRCSALRCVAVRCRSFAVCAFRNTRHLLPTILMTSIVCLQGQYGTIHVFAIFICCSCVVAFMCCHGNIHVLPWQHLCVMCCSVLQCVCCLCIQKYTSLAANNSDNEDSLCYRGNIVTFICWQKSCVAAVLLHSCVATATFMCCHGNIHVLQG